MKNLKMSATKPSYFPALSWSGLLMLMLLGSPPLRAETVTVDLSVGQGAPTYAGSGFLHGMDATNPPAAIIDPLKSRMFRTGYGYEDSLASPAFYARAKSYGASIQYEPSDFYNHTYHVFGSGTGGVWPGDNGNWTNWENFVAAEVNSAKAKGLTLQWDIWNEPDGAFFWARSQAQFFETYRRAVVKIRSIDPNATIVGPSIAYYGTGSGLGQWLKSFLLYAKANNVLPNILSWHELDGTGVSMVTKDVTDIRQFMVANGINISRISLNEIVAPNELSAPGVLVHYLAAIGRLGVESAGHACWHEENNIDNCNNLSLDGILTTTDKSPRPQWWVYKGYADITGTLVGVTPGATTDAVAGRDSGSKKAQIVLGRNDRSAAPTTASIETIIKNISASAPYLINGGKVHVVAKRIPLTYYASLPSPLSVIDADYTVFNDQISVFLNFSPPDAYTITLTPPGGTTTADTSAPSVPTGLSAQAASSSQINLSWTASTDNVGVTGYKILRAGTQIATTAGTSYSSTGLSASTAYSYTVAAYDAAGNTSAPSAAASATTSTASDILPPAKPKNLRTQ